MLMKIKFKIYQGIDQNWHKVKIIFRSLNSFNYKKIGNLTFFPINPYGTWFYYFHPDLFNYSNKYHPPKIGFNFFHFFFFSFVLGEGK